jgi:hypothetical protein
LKGDKEQMNQVVALAKGKHCAEHSVAHAEALALARAARLQAARLSSNRAMDLALQEGQCETAASYRRERCGKPFTEMPPKEKGAPRKR